MLSRIENERNFIGQVLPLEIIQERQSEFSQSMMTNAARMNTNRSKNSRNNRGQQYANNSLVNVSKAASAKKSTINTSEIL